MENKKIVQTILRTTVKEKENITKKAKEQGLSVNEYIKNIVLSDDSTMISDKEKSDIKDDITYKEELDELRKTVLEKYIDIAAYETLKEQLDRKDEQIINLQKIIFNKDTKLIEHQEKKSWWRFWK